MSTKFANEISDLCLKTFNNLPKTGKPNPENEWTILSCILKKDEQTMQLEVVSLGTGTKCIGADALSNKGDILNDSHAEIMARRGFLRYLMDEMNLKSTIFDYSETEKKFKLKNNFSFHFFTTHSPCGDASIFINSKSSDSDEPVAKRVKIEEDENMTGAKLIKTNEKDLMSQNIGEIRTKPGRGIRTLSVSCSDKIARWNVLGIQGAILMSLLSEPIYLKSFTIGDGVLFNIEAMKRSLWKRFKQIELKKPFLINRPEIQIADNKKLFKFLKNDELQPSPSSIVWCKVSNR